VDTKLDLLKLTLRPEWPAVVQFIDILLFSGSESESDVTTNGQSASLSWYKAPIRGLRPDFYFRTEYV
jgi:hypothetical protein